MGKLSARKVKTLTNTGLYSDGDNLYLQVSRWGSKSWIFRYVRGKVYNMGLGAYPDVSLADARDLASHYRTILRKHKDPITEKRRNERDARAKNPTFKDVTEDYIASKKSGWTEKHRKQFENTITTYAHPTLKNLPASEISPNDVLKVLQPIWETKNETASRVRGRIEMVLDYAIVAGIRERENPARWKGHLSHMLPKRSAVSPVKHMPAMPFTDMPEFMRKLRAKSSLSQQCLEFCILTVARVGTVASARWDEIDGQYWTIPAEKMKGDFGEFTIPLSKRALKLLDEVTRIDDSPFIFIGRRGEHINKETPLKYLKQDLGYQEYTVHGFRSTFRDWAAEVTNHENFICEMALSHTIGSGVEAAYRRGALLTKRAKLMEDWATYLNSRPATVTSLKEVTSAERNKSR